MKFKTELLNFQKEAVDKLIVYKSGALFMEMGLGKTRTALSIINKRLKLFDKLWWLCPASILEKTKKEIESHIDINELKDITKIEFISIESLSSSKNIIKYIDDHVISRDFVIVDESSLVKNIEAKRTQNLNLLFGHCKYKLILNGTPTSKGLIDLFAQYKFLSYKILGYKTFMQFAMAHLQFQYDDYGKYRVVKEYHIEHIKKLADPFTVILKKQDVIKLPLKKKDIITVNIDNNIEEKYIQLELEFFDYIKDYDTQDINIIRSYLSNMQRLISGFDGDELHINNKLRVLDKFIKNKKTIVVCKYLNEVKKLNNYYKNSFVITGNVSIKDRNQIIDKFKNSKNGILIMTYGSGGIGFNFQFCNQMCFFTPTYNLAQKLQAEDRIHRIGQKKGCKYIDIVIDESIENRILKTIGNKEHILNIFMEVFRSDSI